MIMRPKLARVETGVRNLDELVNGGIPTGSVTVVAGPPGSGKTILTQQICFHNATPTSRALYISTLSEPTVKTLRYLSQFDFFDRKKLDDGSITFVDLGVIVRAEGLEESSKLVMEQVKKLKPTIVVIDSFRVFDDIARSKDELRKFGYELAVQLMAWETTTLLIGEFGPNDIATNPLFSIIDGLILTSQREQVGEQQRFIQIPKMRGTEHSRDEHAFIIKHSGIEVFAPRVTIHRGDAGIGAPRLKTGIEKVDDLIGEGIPRGSSLLVAGVPGTGKTILLLEFLYRGALAGEKGIIFSFEETEARLRSNARGLGWDFDALVDSGMIEVVFIPQPNILVERDLLMMRERVEQMGAKRVAIDSVSVFMHKVKDPQLAREKIFQLCSIVQNTESVGFFATDIPYGSNEISRFGVEETVVDGIMVLTSTNQGLERQRYIEVYKLRNTAHLHGRHSMTIGPNGIQVFPRYSASPPLTDPKALDPQRIPSGIPGLDEVLHGGLLERSVTLLSGSAGIGKTTMAMQFVAEGATRNEPGLYVTLEEGQAQVVRSAERLGLPFAKGHVDVLYLSHERALASQLLSVIVDKVRESKTRRLVLDSVSQLVPDGLNEGELRQLLFALVSRLKALGVTTVFTMESASMFSSEKITDRSFSALADNLIVLRYAQLPGAIQPTLTVVKTRGSAHDYGTHFFEIGKGGVHVAARIAARKPQGAKRPSAAKTVPKTGKTVRKPKR